MGAASATCLACNGCIYAMRQALALRAFKAVACLADEEPKRLSEAAEWLHNWRSKYPKDPS